MTDRVCIMERDLGSFLLSCPLQLSNRSVLVWGQGGNVGGLMLAIVAVASGGWATFPQFPLDWFKAVAGVGHSHAIWPQPWHLNQWREL